MVRLAQSTANSLDAARRECNSYIEFGTPKDETVIILLYVYTTKQAGAWGLRSWSYGGGITAMGRTPDAQKIDSDALRP